MSDVSELAELNELRMPYLRSDGSYDAGILDIAARYAAMAAIRREGIAELQARIEELEAVAATSLAEPAERP